MTVRRFFKIRQEAAQAEWKVRVRHPDYSILETVIEGRHVMVKVWRTDLESLFSEKQIEIIMSAEEMMAEK